MIDYTLSELFYESSVNKQIIIHGEDFTLTNEDIYAESMEIEEGLNSSFELQFGSCEASSIKFTVANVFNPVIGQWIDVTMILDGHTEAPFKIGRYCIVSDRPNADRTNREIIAYDMMYFIINTDMLSWWNSLSASFTFLQLRNSFFTHLGIEQENISLPNDSQVIKKTEKQSLSGLEVISSICELNGCFGHIGRDNKFHYVFLEEVIEGLYPANDLYPADNLFPKDDSISQIINKASYLSAEYEDYRVQNISQVRLYDSKNVRTASSGTGTNIYNIKNILVDGLNNPSQVCLNAFNKIKSVWYMPSSVEAVGNLCLEVGDSIRLNTSNKIIYTYILSRSLKGIQSLKDSYTAEGDEYRIDDMNGVMAQLANVSAATESNASAIAYETSRASGAESGLNNAVNGVAVRVGTLEADHVSVGTINAISAKVDNIDANYITASTVSSTYATISSLNGVNAKFNNLNADNIKSGTISADRIDADSIASKFSVNSTALNCKSLSATNVTCTSRLVLFGKNVSTKTVGGVTGVLCLTE